MDHNMFTGNVSISFTSSTTYLIEVSGVYGVLSNRSEWKQETDHNFLTVRCLYIHSRFKALQMSYLSHLDRGDGRERIRQYPVQPHDIQSWCDYLIAHGCVMIGYQHNQQSSQLMTHLYLLMVASLIGLQVSRSKQLPSLTVIMEQHYILVV